MKQILKQFYKRLAVEGLVKSVIYSAVVGFGACAVAALVTWFVKPELWWLALVVFGAAMLVSVPAFYFLRFRPSAGEVAERVDRLGLNERAITMLELESDQTIIARLQREDTNSFIKKLSPANLKFAISKVALTVMACVCACGVGATVISALSYSEVIPSGGQLIYAEEEVYYVIEFVVEEGGEILGEEVQIVLAGEDALTVEAVPDENWAFVGWFDVETEEELSTDIYFTEFAVSSDKVIVAKFGELGEDGDGEPGDGDGDGDGDPGDQPEDAPSNQDGEQQDGESGEAPELPQEGAGAGGGGDKEGNNIYDSETPYDELIGEQYDAAMEELQSNPNIPDDIRKLIEEYYNVIN